ncbi:unnamed protein product [Durusdinium trenchii]|uniref:Ion transport domain-containing protein n=1 Tax=Durusdinium trenchii TaxID=1381693 RepID=A0ABP0L528_9DINO
MPFHDDDQVDPETPQIGGTDPGGEVQRRITQAARHAAEKANDSEALSWFSQWVCHKDGATALHRAAAEGNTVVVMALLDARANVNATNRAGATPLHCAVGSEGDGPGVVAELLKNKADVHARTNDGLTAWQIAEKFPQRLHLAQVLQVEDSVRQGDERLCQEDVPLAPARAKGPSPLGILPWLPPHLPHNELKAPEDQTPEKLTTADPETLEAARDGDGDTQANCWDLQAEKKIFATARAAAQEAEDVEALKWFEEYGDWNYVWCTALHQAAGDGALQAVEFLLKSGADKDATDRDWGKTPRDRAVEFGHADVVATLLRAKADGRCPQQLAMNDSNLCVIQEFCRAGAGDLHLLTWLIRTEGPDAVDALEAWMQKAEMRSAEDSSGAVRSLKRAHLRERLRVILAPVWFDRHRGRHVLQAPENYANLEDQNLFFAPEVQVNLCVLPGLCARDACSHDLLEALEETANEGVLQTDVVEAIVSAAWMQMRMATAWDIFCSLLTVALLCHASYTLRHGQPESTGSLMFIAVLHGQKTIEELIQHLSFSFRRYRVKLFEFDNLADACYIAIGWLAVYRQVLVDPSQLEKPFMAIFSAMSWLRALYSFRGEIWMGPRLLPILSALKDTSAFFLVTCTCILAATHAYYNLQLREEPTPTYAAFLQVIRLGIFGDFDLYEFEGVDPTYKFNRDSDEWEPVDPDPTPDYVWAHAVFYFTGVGITILLMNLLIGVLGQNFELYQDQSALLFQRARAKMLLEIKARPWRRIGSGFIKMIRQIWLSEFRYGFLFLWLGASILLMVFLPFLITLGTCVIFIAVTCRIVFQIQLSGIYYSTAVALGYYGPQANAKADESWIWVLVRPERPLEDMRSLRTELRSQLESKFSEVNSTQKKLETSNVEQKQKLNGVEEKLLNMEKALEASGSEQKAKLDGVEAKLLRMESHLERLMALTEKLVDAPPAT